MSLVRCRLRSVAFLTLLVWFANVLAMPLAALAAPSSPDFLAEFCTTRNVSTGQALPPDRIEAPSDPHALPAGEVVPGGHCALCVLHGAHPGPQALPADAWLALRTRAEPSLAHEAPPPAAPLPCTGGPRAPPVAA